MVILRKKLFTVRELKFKNPYLYLPWQTKPEDDFTEPDIITPIPRQRDEETSIPESPEEIIEQEKR